MKQMYLVVILFFLGLFGALAQSKANLEVLNYHNHRSKFIQEGTKVRVIKEGRIFKGILKILSNQSILINSDTIKLNQIQEIDAKTSARQAGGVALLVPSTAVGGFGLWAIGAGLAAHDGYGMLAVIIGAPFAAVGALGIYVGAKLISNGRKFNTSRWEYRIHSSS